MARQHTVTAHCTQTNGETRAASLTPKRHGGSVSVLGTQQQLEVAQQPPCPAMTGALGNRDAGNVPHPSRRASSSAGAGAASTRARTASIPARTALQYEPKPPPSLKKQGAEPEPERGPIYGHEPPPLDHKVAIGRGGGPLHKSMGSPCPIQNKCDFCRR